jgi:predicted RNA polymerase sigma factor
LVGTLDHVFREEWSRVLATLIGFLGDFDLAEEGAQEAFAMAAGRTVVEATAWQYPDGRAMAQAAAASGCSFWS